MKTLNDYMAISYRMEVVEDMDEGGFVVSYPDLSGCITCLIEISLVDCENRGDYLWKN